MLDLLTKHGAKPSNLSDQPRDLTKYTESPKKISSQLSLPPLIEAITQNNLDAFQKGILLGEDVNARDPHSKRTPLHFACMKKRET